MTEESKASPPQDPSLLDENDVAAYLRAHPDFFARNPELLEFIELQHATGSAVSLIERQVDILRGRSQRLEDRMSNLLIAAHDNEKRATNIHSLARALIRAPTLAAAVVGLRARMREDFGIDHVFVGITSSRLKRTDIDGLVRIDPDSKLVKSFDNFFRTKLIECGPIAEEQARLLFPKAEEPPQSAAIVPLEKEKELGMMALGSADKDRFQPRQGKLFLDMTAELVSAVVRARLG